MTVCYFGFYKPDYSRNRIFISGLRKNGVKVIECGTAKTGVAKYFDLIKKHWQIRKQYDLMIVGFPGQQCVILASLLTRKKIVFNALVSLYDSLVFDRKQITKKSWKAKYFWFLDWLSCKFADKIVLDTYEHINYFVKEFRIDKKKFIRVLVGSDDEVIKPTEAEKKDQTFTVHFHGSYIPLQGVEYILGAAKVLKDKGVNFNIVGSKIKNLFGDGHKEYQNINFIPNVPYDDLKKYMGLADVCLGIFGETPKSRRVIANKVYEALAVGQALITSESPATRELFTDKSDVLLCKVANSEDLADKILMLKNDQNLRDKIAKEGYNLFVNNLVPTMLMKQFLDDLK